MLNRIVFVGVFLSLAMLYTFHPAVAAETRPHELRPDYTKPSERFIADALSRTFRLTPHRGSYLLPVSYMAEPNESSFQRLESDAQIDNLEVEFQLSGKMKLWDDTFLNNGDIWVGYTQRSYWQLYNSAQSAPFRETNYKPEAWISVVTDFNVFGLRNRTLDFGFVHQSNGRSEPFSKSWNRLFLNFWLERGAFALSIKPWYRIPESAKTDDNADIEGFLGYGELRAFYHWKEHRFSAMLRNNLNRDENRSGVQLDWVFPVHDILLAYVKYFYGYGDSLVDYNHEMSRLGVGLMLMNW